MRSRWRCKTLRTAQCTDLHLRLDFHTYLPYGTPRLWGPEIKNLALLLPAQAPDWCSAHLWCSAVIAVDSFHMNIHKDHLYKFSCNSQSSQSLEGKICKQVIIRERALAITKVWTKNAKERKTTLDQGGWEGGGGRGGLGRAWCLVRREGI